MNLTIPFIKSWNEAKDQHDLSNHVDFISYDPFFQIDNNTDYEVRQLGKGRIITELKDGSLFEGNFDDWALFKQNYPELIK